MLQVDLELLEFDVTSKWDASTLSTVYTKTCSTSSQYSLFLLLGGAVVAPAHMAPLKQTLKRSHFAKTLRTLLE